MKKIGTFFLKLITGIWCIAFVLFFLSFLLKTLNIVNPLFESYREWFEGLLDFLFLNWLFDLCFGIAFITVFIWFILKSNRYMGWNDLAEKYSFPREKIKKLNIEFDYGQSYFNDIYYNGIHLSSIKQGLILKHPFPFNYISPALLIPWNEIAAISVERGLRRESENNLFSRISEKISPWEYANVKLSSFENITIIIPWKPNVKINAPKELIIR